MKQAAKAAGIILDSVQITDLSFVVDNNKRGIYCGKRDVARYYDAIGVRNFFPYISEALTVVRCFHEQNKIVAFDKELTEQGYGYTISKMHDYLMLAQNGGLAVPQSWKTCDRKEIEEIAAELGFPCVLKGDRGKQGLQVHKVHSMDELRSVADCYSQGELIVQEYLDTSEDYRVLTLGYKSFPYFLKRHPRRGDFRTNYALEGEGEAIPIKEFPQLIKLAESASRVLGREFAGVDIRADSVGNLKVLEVNRTPEFEGFESEQQARDFCAELKSKYNLDSFVVKR